MLCTKCRKKRSVCICALVRPFDSSVRFVILIHPKENRKRVGTGRMTHLCLSNSFLFEGIDFTDDERVNAILSDSTGTSVVLYPGNEAADLQREHFAFAGKKLTIFVIDASWFFANKIMRLSKNLQALPLVRFQPPRPSEYRIRKQPMAHCFSTVEAVHYMIGKLDPKETRHHNLLEVFQSMVEKQLSFVKIEGQKAVRGER